jgi:chloramphenicol O-acetyltransferase type A
MRTIDMESWPRRGHFALFSGRDYPYVGLCANVELTAFYAAVKQRGASFNVAMVYVLARAGNEVPEFRYRIRGTEVVEHEVVHPATTIMTGEDLFSFCFFEYKDDFSSFAEGAAEQIARVKEHLVMEDEPGRDDWLFMTALPWVSFTSFVHPINLSPADSVPRLGWGKYFREGAALKMPLSVQVHHGLVDGIHIGRFFSLVEGYLERPEELLGAG